jgi:hypothetical protein
MTNQKRKNDDQCILEDLFTLEQENKVKELRIFTVDIIPLITEQKYNQRLKVYAPIFREALKTNHPMIMQLIFFYCLNKETEMKNHVCDSSKISKPVPVEKRQRFFKALTELSTQLQRGVIKEEEYLLKILQTLRLSVNWFSFEEESTILPQLTGQTKILQ